jgi:predicted phage terminase large subunit-like protein
MTDLLSAPRVPCSTSGHRYGPDYEASPKQNAFLMETCREALYGGAAGGGKTDALMRAALQYACVPGYAALLVRQTHPQLAMEGGFIERSQEWLAGTDATWNAADKRWSFPGGGTLTFMHMERAADRFKIQGAEFHFIGFDELTNWPTDQVYRFSAARLRKPNQEHSVGKACATCGMTLADVPLRMRAGTNPGSSGEAWVQTRFVDEWQTWKLGNGAAPVERKFLPAFAHDNPGLNQEEYSESLDVLDEATRQQLKDGTWGIRVNVMLKRDDFIVTDEWPRDGARLVRSWDFASTEADGTNDPDWTVGALLALNGGQWWLVDVVRDRIDPGAVERLFMRTLAGDHERYGNQVETVIEREPGSSGKLTVAAFQRMAAGYSVNGLAPLGAKSERARPLAAATQNGNFRMVKAPWNELYLEEAVLFPDACPHDDQIDATTGGMAWLTQDSGRGGLRYTG